MNRNLIVVDGESFYDIARTPDMTDAQYHRLYQELSDWAKSCCPHPDMKHCTMCVGSWPAVRVLQQTLKALGIEKFPVLSRHIPDGNGGFFPADLAEAGVLELNILCDALPTLANLFLVDADTGKEIYEYVAAYHGEFLFGGKSRQAIGFDKNGIFVRHLDTGEILFRGKTISQKIGKPLWGEKTVTLIDEASGVKHKITTPIGGEIYKRLTVIERALTPQDISAIKPLDRLLRASIETGNPIVWC